VRYIAQTKVKQMQWDKLADHVAMKTVWAKHMDDREKLEEMFANMLKEREIFNQIEDMFAAKVIEQKEAPKEKEESETKEVTVLNPKRSYNINIVIGRLKSHTFEQIRYAVLGCDTAFLQEPLLRQFLKLIPTAEEKGLLATIEGADHIGRADAFFIEMLKVDRYEQRLKALHFMLLFEERFSDLDRDVNAVIDATIGIQTSETFPKILELILVVGNYMNGGGFRGSARAIKINSINKLMDTKGSDNQTTLLHFLANCIEQQFPELLRFLEELKHVTGAARVSFSELTSEFNDMKRQLEDIKQELDTHFADPAAIPPHDKFVLVTLPFVDKNLVRFADVERRFEIMKSSYDQLVLMYGEDPKSTQPEEFFGIFKIFMTSFDKVLKDNQKVREVQLKALERKHKEVKEKEKKEERLRKKKEQEELKRQQKDGEPGEDKGMMDKLLESLRTGAELDSAGKRTRGRGPQDNRERKARNNAARRSSVSARTMELLNQMKVNPEDAPEMPPLPTLTEKEE
jgi:6-pyruvoyl-tetrahydropterin synthase